MTQLTGIKDGEYLAQFLGKKIAIKATDSVYGLFPKLTAIYAWGQVDVEDSNGVRYRFSWEDCENPYVILQTNVKVEIK